MSDTQQGQVVFFSLKDDAVWASRADGRPPVFLGPHDEVVQAMDDFMRQADFAERLLSMAAKARSPRT